MYTVTRQHRWPDGLFIVEISAGGLDYTNPDALTERYAGEFVTYQDAREAIETAWEIAEAWQNDTKEKVYIGIGNTWAGSLSLDEMELTPAVKRYLGMVGRKLYDQAEKCDCGEILPEKDKRYTLIDDYDGVVFCSERCAEKAWEQQEEYNLSCFCEVNGLDLEAVRDYAGDNNLTLDGLAAELDAGTICSEL